MLYVDTSALIKLYVAEAGSERMLGVLDGQTVVTSVLAWAEVFGALARRLREGRHDRSAHDTICQQFMGDWKTLVRLPISEQICERSRLLLHAYPLRSADAIHLGSAMDFRGSGQVVVFVASDKNLLAAARGEGFIVEDPAAFAGEAKATGGR